jgi:mannitol/fructose-specific phosphotransferase system IIA component (Ntr-type)
MTDFPLIDLPSEVDTANSAVARLVAELVRRGILPSELADEAVRAVWQRERLGSTAIGKGIAIPHGHVRDIEGSVVVVGRCERDVEWPESLDGAPVRVIVLVLIGIRSPPSQYSRILNSIARRFRDGFPPGDPA